MTVARIAVCLLVLALAGGLVFTQEPAKEKAKASAEPKPATHKVEKKAFKVELAVKGILEAEETADISYRLQPSMQPSPAMGPLSIRTIVAHGSPVKQGDVLAAFDTTKMNEAIEDLEKERKSMEVALKLAEEELPLFEKSVPVELAAALNAKKRADEELKYFLEVGKGQTVKQLDNIVKMYKFDKDFAEDELRQLEKMYKSNDLTEETEKMVLRRQRFYLEMYTFMYEQFVIMREHTLNFTLPNTEIRLKETQTRNDIALEKAHKTLGPTALQKQVTLAKLRRDFEKGAARLERFIKDRDSMTIHAPFDGVAYHGKFRKGQWTGADDSGSRLVPKGTVMPDEVFLTVVKPRPLVVNVAFEEKDVHLLKPGLQGTAKLAFNPERKLAARVSKFAAVPAAPGKYQAQVLLDLDASDANLMPGMACSLKFVPYSKKDALVVPSKAIHEEDDDHFVYVHTKGSKSEKRPVTPGHVEGDQTEILAGVRAGEEILLERPKTPEKSAPTKEEKKEGDAP
jgi:HlyD family secretion protein